MQDDSDEIFEDFEYREGMFIVEFENADSLMAMNRAARLLKQVSKDMPWNPTIKKAARLLRKASRGICLRPADASVEKAHLEPPETD